MIQVIKFGGTSLGTPERIRAAVDIVQTKLSDFQLAIVVSALGGVTNDLIKITDREASDPGAGTKLFEELKKRHLDTAHVLLSDHALEAFLPEFQQLIRELKSEIKKLATTDKDTDETRDRILSFGERLSVRLFTAVLNDRGIDAGLWDSHKIIRTDDSFGEAVVDMKTTRALIAKNLLPLNGIIPVITGFIGSTSDNRITTLGRSGSDYTAGIIGEVLKAESVEIWTDVNGVFTADPNQTPTAITIPQLHYSEMAEMSHFGAKVLHPRTVSPLERRNIPISIKNTFDPTADGTIVNNEYSPAASPIRSVTVKNNLTLIGLYSRGLDQIPQLLRRAFKALDEAKIRVYFNTATSTELGCTLLVDEKQSDKANRVLYNAFAEEFDSGILQPAEMHNNVSLITVIGNQLQQYAGLVGSLLEVLAHNNIHPLSLAKGVSNMHFGFILPAEKTLKAARLLNDHFCVSDNRVRLFVAGIGTIGGELLHILEDLKEEEIEYSVIGACTREKVYWNAHGIRPKDVPDLVEHGDSFVWQDIIETMVREFDYRTIFVDATGSPEVARLYLRLLENGIHIVTPSKMANTAEQSYFNDLKNAARENHTCFFYETTVGAGLPVIHTIQDLKASGDSLVKVEGVVSGTLTYIYDQLQKGVNFSEAITRARELGYTEPDPRDDLSGEDVARKFITLARCWDIEIERDHMEVESLVPAGYEEMPLADFMKKIKNVDPVWRQKVEKASIDGKRLRYQGVLKDGRIRIGTRAVDAESPFGRLHGTDNLIAIYTRRYFKQPLIVQGPGAGREVTAAGLLSDIQKVGRYCIKLP